MAYGLNIFNLNNFIQIDDNYDNMTVIEEGSVGNDVAIVPPTASQLLLVRPSSATGTIATGPPGTFRSSSGSIRFVRLERGAMLPGMLNNYGLIVRNASGVVFDSGRPYANTLSLVTLSTNEGSSASVTLPSSIKNRYVVSSGLGMTQMRAHGMSGTVIGPRVNFVSSTQITVSITAVSSGPMVDAGPFSPIRSLLIMEV